MTEPMRKPAVFDVDDPRLIVTEPEDNQYANRAAPAVADAPGGPRSFAPKHPMQRMRWGALLGLALSALVLLAFGLAVADIVEASFTRTRWLGVIALFFSVVAGTALTMLIVREVAGLAGLAAVESLRSRAQSIIETDDRDRGRALVGDLIALTRRIPRLARARARLAGHRTDIIDGRDLVRLAERDLMSPLDAEARRLVVAAGKRVSVVTAISPRATVDLFFVLINALSLIRGLAVLYGGRPGTLGVLKLFRQVVSHLVLTGGVALTDSVVQQVVGHGLAARLSARLGEGMVNGLLTARLGLLAIDLVRPLPFYDLPRPTLNDLAGMLLRSPGEVEASETPGPKPAKGE